jgi:sulfur-oxidizing protein SoxY
MSKQRSRFVRAALLCATLCLGPSAASAETPNADDPWPEIAKNAFDERPLIDGAGLLAIDMPYRAEDAAIVPVTVRATLPPGDTRRFKSFTIIIDQNPAPVAATFTIGPDADVSSISTRVRVNSYTDVHAVGELSDGKLYAVKTYVKASGGCSAPALKDADETNAHLGEMRFRQFGNADAAARGPREAQIMIRHPNNSGLQMDQVTHLYVPAFFVHHLQVRQGDAPLLSMDGGISISEDPNIRFTYVPNGARTFRAEATDTDNHVFRGEWPVDASQM